MISSDQHHITHRAFPFKVISKSNSDTASNWFLTSTQLLGILGVIAELFSKVLSEADFLTALGDLTAFAALAALAAQSALVAVAALGVVVAQIVLVVVASLVARVVLAALVVLASPAVRAALAAQGVQAGLLAQGDWSFRWLSLAWPHGLLRSLWLV